MMKKTVPVRSDDVERDELIAQLCKISNAEGGSGTFDRWMGAPTPLYRCTANHVAIRTYQAERGIRTCMRGAVDGAICNKTALLTFPDDTDGPLVHEAFSEWEPDPKLANQADGIAELESANAMQADGECSYPSTASPGTPPIPWLLPRRLEDIRSLTPESQRQLRQALGWHAQPEMPADSSSDNVQRVAGIRDAVAHGALEAASNTDELASDMLFLCDRIAELEASLVKAKSDASEAVALGLALEHKNATRITELEAENAELKNAIRVFLTACSSGDCFRCGEVLDAHTTDDVIACLTPDELSLDDCWICGEGAGHVLADCPTDPETHPRP